MRGITQYPLYPMAGEQPVALPEGGIIVNVGPGPGSAVLYVEAPVAAPLSVTRTFRVFRSGDQSIPEGAVYVGTATLSIGEDLTVHVYETFTATGL